MVHAEERQVGLVNPFLAKTNATDNGSNAAPEFTAEDLDLIAQAEAIVNEPELAVA